MSNNNFSFSLLKEDGFARLGKIYTSRGEINTPTLITVGKYDEITPKCSQTIHNGIKNSQMHIFQKSGHIAHLEEMKEYMEIVEKFITKNE